MPHIFGYNHSALIYGSVFHAVLCGVMMYALCITGVFLVSRTECLIKRIGSGKKKKKIVIKCVKRDAEIYLF